MGYNGNNVVVSLASSYIQPWSASVPAALPPELTIGLGGDWTNGGALPWADLGGTDQGWKMAMSRKTNEIMIEEQSNPVKVTADSANITISGNLAEDDLQHMLWAYGGGTLTTVAPGTTQIGKTTLQLSDTLVDWAMGVEFQNKYGFWRRVLLPKGNVTSSPSTNFRRAADKHMYDFEFTTTCKISDLVIVEMTANHT